MRGKTHAMSASAVGAFIATPQISVNSIFSNPPEFISWISISTGWIGDLNLVVFLMFMTLIHGSGMVPDIDHHNGTIAHSLPKIGPIGSPTALMCRFIGKISGGHRYGTHSIVGVIIMTALTWLAVQPEVEIYGKDIPIGAGIIALFLTAFTLKVLKIKSENWLYMWGLSILISGAMTWFYPSDLAELLPWVVGIGSVVHIAGDMITKSKVPIFYPFTKKRFGVNLLGTVNTESDRTTDREDVVFIVLSIYTGIMVAVGFTHFLMADYMDTSLLG